MSPVADKLAVQQLQAAYNATDYCTFWACPGGDGNRVLPMATCHNCYTRIMLRRALKRMGIYRERDD